MHNWDTIKLALSPLLDKQQFLHNFEIIQIIKMIRFLSIYPCRGNKTIWSIWPIKFFFIVFAFTYMCIQFLTYVFSFCFWFMRYQPRETISIVWFSCWFRRFISAQVPTIHRLEVKILKYFDWYFHATHYL
jgi:hypothetical protein